LQLAIIRYWPRRSFWLIKTVLVKREVDLIYVERPLGLIPHAFERNEYLPALGFSSINYSFETILAAIFN